MTDIAKLLGVEQKTKTKQKYNKVEVLSKVRAAFENHLRLTPIGEIYKITLDDGKVVHGYLTGRSITETKTMTNMGTYKMHFALMDGTTQRLTMAESKFINNKGEKTGNSVQKISEQEERNLVKREEETDRENRYFITGNVLSGYSLLKGGAEVSKINFYEENNESFDESSGIKRGLLLPKSFKESDIKKIAVSFHNHREVLSYLHKAKNNARVSTFDDSIVIQRSGDKLIFIVNKDAMNAVTNPQIADRFDSKEWKVTAGFDRDRFGVSGLKNTVNLFPNQTGDTRHKSFDILAMLDEKGFKFRTISEKEMANEAIHDDLERSIGSGDGVGAMKTPSDDVIKEEIKKDTPQSRLLLRKARNSLTNLLNTINNKYNPRLNKDATRDVKHFTPSGEETDRLTVPPEHEGRHTKPGFIAGAPVILNKIATPETTFNKIADKRLVNLITKGREFAAKIRVKANELVGTYRHLKKKYKNANFAKVTDLLLVGDASGIEFTRGDLKKPFDLDQKIWRKGKNPKAEPVETTAREELKRQGFSKKEIRELENTKYTEEEITLYQELRKLYKLIGAWIDRHRRAMAPKVYRMIQYHKRNMESFIASEDVSDLRKLIMRFQSVRRKEIFGKGNPSELQAELNEIESRILSMEIREGREERFLDSFNKLKIEDAKMNNLSVRRREGYIPHLFFGSFRIKIYEGLDTSGNEVWENIPLSMPKDLIASLKKEGRSEEQIKSIIDNIESSKRELFFSSKEDAINAAREYLRANKKARLKIEPVEMKYMFDEVANKTTLADKEYNRIMNGLSEKLSEELSEKDFATVTEKAESLMKRKGRFRHPSFTMYRKGIRGYVKDMDKIFEAFARSSAKYVYMDTLKYEYINLMEKKGWGETSEITDKEGQVIAQMFERWWKDFNDIPQPLETTIDRTLDQLASTFKGKMFTSIASGALVGTLIGMTITPMTAMIAGSTMGVLMYRAMGKSRNKSRALTGEMLSIGAHLKLGFFFNLASAMVNLTQTAINTGSVHSYANVAKGIRRAGPALYRVMKGDFREIIANPEKHSSGTVRAAQDAMLLTKHADIRSDFFFTDENPDIFASRTKIGKISMFWFQSAETMNRSVSFLTTFNEQLAMGKNRKQAIKAAQLAVTREHFEYGNVAKPEFLRNVFLRVPLQFKNWFVQEITFAFGLRGAQIPKFLGHMFFLAGLLGSIFWLPFEILMRIITLNQFSPTQWLKEWAIKKQGEGDLSAVAAQIITRGAPSVALDYFPGVNLSARVGLADKGPFPDEISDLQGPLISTFMNMGKLDVEGASIADQLVNLSPAFKPLKAVEAMASGMPIESAFTDPETFGSEFWKTLSGDQPPIMVDQYRNRQIKYETDFGDLFKYTMGFQTTLEAQMSDIISGVGWKNERRQKEMNNLKTEINNTVRKYKNNPTVLRSELKMILEEAIANGLNLSKAGVKRIIRDAHLGLMDRKILESPKHMRPEIIEQIKALEQFYGNDAISEIIK